MERLTSRQRAIYDFVAGQIQLRGLPPTLMEIAEAFDLNSPAGVSDHLNAIQRKGYIRRTRGVSRGIELLSSDRPGRRASILVPVIGVVPSVDGLRRPPTDRGIYVDGRMVGSRAFAVRAATAIPDLGILVGDYLVIDDSEQKPGQLVLGRQGNNTLLLRMSSRNRAKAVAGDLNLRHDLEILGPVGGVIRCLNGFEA